MRAARAVLPEERVRGASGEAIFRLMVESVETVAFFLIDLEGTVASWGVGAERVEGYATEEALGLHFSSFYTEDAVASGQPARDLRQARQDGRMEMEGQRRRRDGRVFRAYINLTALRGADGELLGYANVTRDLTELRSAEEKVRRTFEQLQSVMDSSSDAVLQVGFDWRILYGNRRAGQMLADFVLGKDLWACFPALAGTPIEASLRRAMRDRVSVMYENHFEPYNQWFRVRADPTEEGIGVFCTDITSEKSMQSQLALEQARREKRLEALSQMAGGLAHEINNPLAIIHARASDLRALSGDGRSVAGYEVSAACQSIVQSADRAMRVLRALQGFARETTVDACQAEQPLELVHQCLDLLEPRFHRHGIELRLELEREPPQLVCRGAQIRQILTNLLNNAVDAVCSVAGGEPGCCGWVLLRLASDDRELRLEVSDSGPTVEVQFRSHLMDPFFTEKVRGVGLGVGLSLSRTIAQEHGGRLELLEGTGLTCFRLTLPLDGGMGAATPKPFVLLTEGGRAG